MKKVLSTALILGALYGTANAAPITSPIYMPETGKILSDLSIGYTTSAFDTVPHGDDDKLEESLNINAEGKIGLMDRLSLNYGFELDLARKLFNEDASIKFTNFYLGVTGRVVDAGINKLDVILNIGQEEAPMYFMYDQAYIDLAVRYGLELDIYNLGFSINGKYINDAELPGFQKLKRGISFGFALENEFILGDNFTIGLDLFYKMNDDIKNGNDKTKAYSEYGFGLDGNYALNQNNFIGAYFGMSMNDIDILDDHDTKDVVEYKFGVKLTSQF